MSKLKMELQCIPMIIMRLKAYMDKLSATTQKHLNSKTLSSKLLYQMIKLLSKTLTCNRKKSTISHSQSHSRRS